MKCALSAALAATVVALLAATGAAAAPPDDQPTPVGRSEVVAQVRDLTASGAPKGPWRTDVQTFGPGSPSFEHDPDAQPPGPPVSARVARTASQSGCRETRVFRRDFSFDGSKLWEVELYRRWCWNYPQVTGASATPFCRPYSGRFSCKGTSGYGGAYTWCCGVWNSGYKRYQEWTIEEIIPVVNTVIGRTFPWIEHRAFANGGGCYWTDKNTGTYCWNPPA